MERAFARWLAAPQALVGFFPRLLETWTPLQVRAMEWVTAAPHSEHMHVRLHAPHITCFPSVWHPPRSQYLGEQVAFALGRYNAMLTAAEFVSLDVLKRYWTERYGWGELL